MDTYKIAKKYCTDDKVQVMFSNAPSQIICSKDGYLYLRDNNITIHKYLSDSQRNKMPYHNNPAGKWHATHLFKYDQVYVKFTRYRHMNDGIPFMNDGYILSFLYFYKNNKEKVISSEMYLSDFEKKTGEMTLTKKELKEFLYGTSKVKGKYIFDNLYGIRYAKSVYEKISIDKDFLNLSNSSIVDLYNDKKAPINIVSYTHIYDKNNKNDDKDDKSWKVNKIDQISEEFNMTSSLYKLSLPIMIEITDSNINAFEFEVFYCNKNCFKIKYKKASITPNLEAILYLSETSDYTTDPSFDE